MKQIKSHIKCAELKPLFDQKSILSALICGVFFMAFASGIMAQTAGELDTSFAPALANYEGGGTVITTFAVQPDGKILVGGIFAVFGDKVMTHLARLNQDGTIDSTFKPVIDGSVMKIVLQPDGKIIIGGGFFRVNSVNRMGLARLNADGSLDTGFNPTLDSNQGVKAIALQPDGKILIDSFVVFLPFGNQTRILRLNADGSGDSSFNADFTTSGFAASIKVISVQPDGKILAGGDFRAVNGASRINFARLNTDGSLDGTFTSNQPNGIPLAILPQPDGKILVGGTFSVFNGVNRNGITRLNADGTTDAGFVPNTGGSVSDIFLQSDGKILLGGDVPNGIVRLNTDGSADAGFNAGANPLGQNARIITVQTDGRILTGSVISGIAPVQFLKIARLNSNGSQDAAFQFLLGGSFGGAKVFVQPDSKILIYGRFFAVGGMPRRAIARLNVDGTLDTSFVPPHIDINTDSAFAAALALQPDGKILLGGSFLNSIGNRSGVIRLNPNGSLDNSFSSGVGIGASSDFTSAIRSIAVAPDGKIYVGGIFSVYDGISRGSFVRLNSDGTVDTTFTMQATSNSQVLDVEVQPDGKVLAAGAIFLTSGNFTGQITRFNPNNTVDTTFNYGSTTGNIIKAFALQRNGKIVVAEFNRVLRVNENGSPDNTFAPADVGGSANDVAVQQNGKIVIGGDFTTINNTARISLARLNQDGTLDPIFTPAARLAVGSLALQSDGKILLGGGFSTINGVPRTGLARLFGDAVVPARTRFDFDGDGRADISIFRPGASAEWYWLNSANNQSSGLQFGTGTDKPVPADYDGDGKTDVAVFRNGDWYRLNSSNNQFVAFHFGQAGDIPVLADYDGDGKADFAVYRQGNWYILNSSNDSFRAAQFGISTDKPVIGDFDGDGKADLVVYRPSDGVWYRINSGSDTFSANQFGVAEDKPVPADYDGDGKTDLAVYRPSVGNWYIINSGNSSFSGIHFGITEDKPAPADFDGDGRADLAVFRPSSGTWYLLRTTAGFTGIQFGANGDVPAPNAFVR